MTKKAILTDISTGYASNATMNANFNAVNDKLDNTLSLDGSAPNALQADLDLNSNDIINANDVNSKRLFLNGVLTTSTEATPTWRGAWVTATEYLINDIVKESGDSYIALVDHTAGTFSTDLTANLWDLFLPKGATGAGTGDLLAANNLSDLDNVPTARSNLNLGTAATENVGSFATSVQGTTADNALPLASVLDEDNFATNSATLPPSQQSTKAFVLATAGVVSQSSALVYPSNSSVSFAHGLGYWPAPGNYGAYFVWKGGSTNGFVDGDTIPIYGTGDDDGSGFNIIVNDTTIRFVERTSPVMVNGDGTNNMQPSSSLVDVYLWVRS